MVVDGRGSALPRLSAVVAIAAVAGLVLMLIALCAAELDDLQLTVRAHKAIAAIYHQRRSELGASVKGYRLVELQCMPPLHSEECWIMFDPSHGSGVDAEVGRWHRPSNYPIFPTDTFRFGSVDIRRIDADAYSVLTRSGPDW